MDSKERIRHCILSLLLPAVVLTSCLQTGRTGTEEEVKLILLGETYSTKAYEPDEDLLRDIHIFIFASGGEMEYSIHTDISALEQETDGWVCEVKLVKGRAYDIYACANLGYDPVIRNQQDIRELSCHLVWPDDYRSGIPMSCQLRNTRIPEGRPLFLKFKRLMSKISIRMDRSRLSDDVKLNVRDVKIGNCPKKALVFSKNTVSSRDELFSNGFVRDEMECSPLNSYDHSGISGEISLYMLENMQGRIEGTDGTAAGKLFPEKDGRSRHASYVEIGIDYLSSKHFTDGKELKYRFWLGENNTDVNIERNCHYRMKICPEDDGLKADGWRIDKSGLRESYDKPEFKIMPGRYISGKIGQYLHIWCEYFPSYAPFDIGLEELENDKARGIYDYSLDPDGKGVTLHLMQPGQGILYMEAGPPVNKSDMVYVEIYAENP